MSEKPILFSAPMVSDEDRIAIMRAKLAWAKAKRDHDRGRPLTVREKLDNLDRLLEKNS